MEHACDLAERIGNLLFHERSSDVTLIVEGERLSAHKAILGISSEYFGALLLGDMKESTQNEVVLREVPLRGIKLLMSYVYTGQLELHVMDVEIILEILELAHLYGFEKLQLVLCNHLQEKLNLENVCAVFNMADRFRFEELREVCRCMIIKKPLVVLRSDTFLNLSESALCHLISDDTFCAEEIDIFVAVSRWCAKLPAGADRSNVLGKIRLPLIDSKDLLSTVMDSGLIAKEVMLDAIRMKECQATGLKFRATLRNGVNLADPGLGACQMRENRGNIFTALWADSISAGYRFESLAPYPADFKLNSKSSLTVALGELNFINHVAFRIEDPFGSAYYIEVSVDSKNWVRVIDYRDYICGSLQDLYFESRAARFIRISVLEEKDVKISALEVTHESDPLEFVDGFYTPSENVATAACGAWLGVEKRKPGTEKRELVHLGEAEWMTHEIGFGSIMVIFRHPCTVGSMKMLLKSDDPRAYKYCIETSKNFVHWKRVVNNTSDFCSSWQIVTFDAHPVLAVRIIGTDSSLDKHFSISHLECPAPADIQAQEASENLLDHRASGTA